jgi:Na+-translocating ferredoxin:NAD+ oxidoreductase subunit A
MSSLLVILIGTVLTNTFLLMNDNQALGGSRQAGSVANAIRIGGGSLLTLVVSVGVAVGLWRVVPTVPTDTLLLAYSLSVLAVVMGLHWATRNRWPRLQRSLASSPILIVGNCLALGAVLLTSIAGNPFLLTLGYALALGLSFVLLLALFVALIARVSEHQVPTAFRFAPITFISAGLLTLALTGFTGLLRS